MSSEPPASDRVVREGSACVLLLWHLGGAFSFSVAAVALWDGISPSRVGIWCPLWVSLCLVLGLVLLPLLRWRVSLFWGAGVVLLVLLCQLAQVSAWSWRAESFWVGLFWAGFLPLALLFLAPFFLFRAVAKKAVDRLFIALLFLLSALLPSISLLIGLVLWFPEGFLGDPGRMHHMGINYGQILAILLGLCLARLYQISGDGFLGRRLMFGLSVVLSVGVSALGLMALTIVAHPFLALGVGLLGALGAFGVRSLVLGEWPVFAGRGD